MTTPRDLPGTPPKKLPLTKPARGRVELDRACVIYRITKLQKLYELQIYKIASCVKITSVPSCVKITRKYPFDAKITKNINCKIASCVKITKLHLVSKLHLCHLVSKLQKTKRCFDGEICIT